MASPMPLKPTPGSSCVDCIDLTDDTVDFRAATQQVSPVSIKQERVDEEDKPSVVEHAGQNKDSVHVEMQPPEGDEPNTLQHPPLPELAPDNDMGMDELDALRLYIENQSNLEDDQEAEITGGFPAQDGGVDDNVDLGDWNNVLDADPTERDALAAAAFARRKEEYNRMKSQGTATQIDDIEFAKEEAAEERRLRNLERGQMILDDPPAQASLPSGYVAADSLFFPETPTVPEPRPKKRATPKPRNRLTAKDTRDAIAVRLDAGFDEGKKSRRKSSKEGGQPKKRTNQKGGVKKPAQKKSRKQRPNLANLQSLGRTDIVQAAQANASRPDMPTFSSRDKAKALQQLVASIPSGDPDSHSSDRQAILEATRKFKGHGAVRSDGQGGWKLKGMESSLYHHQLLGAAFLRDRENGGSKPKGGMVCDEMGFGKTIQMIANILDGKADENNPIKTTLIIAPPCLLNQWMHEMDKHVKDRSLGSILRYHSGSRLVSNDVLADLMRYDVILTSYGEVQKSYPMPEPPKHLASEEKKNEWWAKFYNENVGPLHRIKFHRIVLDEAHHIKNHKSKTSIAVRALTGNFKWCITGTPIMNYIEELYSYFSFLKVPHVGDFATFHHNFCDNRSKGEPIDMGRIHNILRSIMLRRTHVDTLFNAPVVKLPGIKHTTHMVEFNKIERHIYNMVKSRYIHQINTYSRSGELTSHYGNILAMLGRLRMLCSHTLLCQDTLKQLFAASDVETLWRLTANEVVETNGDDSQSGMIAALRKILRSNQNSIQTCQTKDVAPTIASDANAATAPEVETENDLSRGSNYALTFKFRKFLRSLSASDAWTELHLRSTCAKCRLPPDDPWCTSCFHVYCKECLNAMDFERRERGERETTCIECGAHFEQTSACLGLKDLGFNSTEVQQKIDKRKRPGQRRTSGARRSTSASVFDEDDEAEQDDDWIEIGGDSLPSAKLTATKAAILNWKRACPGQKIIIYTQFLGLCRILSKMCTVEQWGHVLFNGKMTLEARGKAIEKFGDDPETFIMICSLKAGGVGLNLTMASKVIILDLWFNSAVEAQAYCRAFRIGQESHVEVLRFVVKDSIDEDLIRMQDAKDIEVSGAIGPESHGDRATIAQLLELFGEVKEDGQNEFILVDDDNGHEDDNVDVVNRLPPRPF